jgi:hypothetical protein
MNEFDQLSYLDSVEVFTSEEEYSWDDPQTVPNEEDDQA